MKEERQMIVRPAKHWGVLYRNVDGQLREHKYWTRYHAEQFAYAMSHPSAGVTEIEIVERNDEDGYGECEIINPYQNT
jgi:hypothetical protein